jgi:hypothetical protein
MLRLRMRTLCYVTSKDACSEHPFPHFYSLCTLMQQGQKDRKWTFPPTLKEGPFLYRHFHSRSSIGISFCFCRIDMGHLTLLGCPKKDTTSHTVLNNSKNFVAGRLVSVMEVFVIDSWRPAATVISQRNSSYIE